MLVTSKYIYVLIVFFAIFLQGTLNNDINNDPLFPKNACAILLSTNQLQEE